MPAGAAVGNPTFSVPGATYDNVQNVSLSSTTSGASFRYTLDGLGLGDPIGPQLVDTTTAPAAPPPSPSYTWLQSGSGALLVLGDRYSSPWW